MIDKNLIPPFVLNEYKKGKYKKNFFAHTLVINIAGFSQLVQTFIEQGASGAEQLTTIINQLFIPLSRIIEKNHGFISSFSGENFITIFPDIEIAHIDFQNLTKEIITLNNDFNIQHNYDITIALSIKVGVGFGETKMEIIESEYHVSYLFSGLSIDYAFQALHKAHLGQANFSFPCDNNSFATDPKIIEYKDDIYNNFTDFIPPELKNYQGNNRNVEVVTCYISFEVSSDKNKFINRVMQLALRYGGYFDRVDYNEDGFQIIVIFGAFRDLQDSYIRACNFALEVRNNYYSKTRIGLSYGYAYVGLIGNGDHCRYTILGMTVSLARRMSINAKENEILVDKYIYNKGYRSFQIIMKGYKAYQGFNSKIPTYILSTPKYINEFLSFKSNFIGREKQLLAITQKINTSCTDVVASILNIYGEKGVGKTRLVAELVNIIGKTNHTWVYMECDSVFIQKFNPIISFFKYYFKINLADGYMVNHKKIVKVIDTLALNISNKILIHELNSCLGLFETLLGIKDFNADKVDKDIVKSRHENTLYAIANIFRLMSLNNPTVIIIDNFDYIDPESYNFIKYFKSLIKNYPITLVALSRSKQAYLSEDFPQLSEDFFFKLENLNDLEATKMVTTFLSDNLEYKLDIEDDTVAKIVKQSAGNPFYIEQIVSYIKRETLLRDNNSANNKNFDIPPTIEQMIQERINKLDNILQEVVKVATILGNKFDKRILQETLNEGDVSRFLAEGEIENFWYPSIENKYIFRNNIYRNSIYQSLVPQKRKEIHQKALQAMEKIYQDNLNKHYEELIYNSINGGINVKAIMYLQQAINESVKYHKFGAANKFCQQLIGFLETEQIDDEDIMNDTILKRIEINLEESKIDDANDEIEAVENRIKPNTPEWLKLNFLKAKSLFMREQYNELINFLKEIMDSYKGSEYEIYLTIYYLDSLRYLNRSEEFESISQDLLEKYLDEDNDLYVSRIANLLGVYFMEKSKYYDALHYFKLNLNLIENINPTNFMASGAHNIGVMTYHLGDKYQAKSYYLKALQYADETGNRLTKCRILSDLAMLEYTEKNIGEANSLLKEALEIARLSQNTNQESRILYNLALINISIENYDKALSYALECRNIGVSMNNLRTQSFVNNIIAQVYIKLGKYCLADKIIMENINHQKRIDDLEGVANSYGLLGISSKNQKQYAEAGKHFESEFKILNELGSKQSEGIALFNWASCDLELGHNEKALSKLYEALDVFTKCNHESGIKSVKELIEKLED